MISADVCIVGETTAMEFLCTWLKFGLSYWMYIPIISTNHCRSSSSISSCTIWPQCRTSQDWPLSPK